MSTPQTAAQYIAPILPESEAYHQIRMTEVRERTAVIERLVAASMELPPMAVGDPPMHPVARAMIAAADEAMAFLALSDMHPDDPQFQHAAAVEADARVAASQAVSTAIRMVELHDEK